MIHYGPVRKDSFYGALCGTQSTVGQHVTMSTHKPYVDCGECHALLAEQLREKRTKIGAPQRQGDGK